MPTACKIVLIPCVGCMDGYTLSEAVSRVVVARLQEVNALIADEIDYAMLLRNPTRPHPRTKILERLRFADTIKWIAHDRFDEREDAERRSPVGLDPVAKIFSKLELKHGIACDRLIRWRQVAAHGAANQSSVGGPHQCAHEPVR